MRGKKIGPVVAAVLAAQCLVAEAAFAAPFANQDPYDVRQLSVRDLGDLNGDGVSEVVIGKGWQDIARADEGAVFIVQRDSDCQLGDVMRITEGEAGLRLELQAGDRFGASIAPVGDLDGDGVVDLVVGVPGSDDGGWTNAGALHVLFLAPDGSVAREQAVSSTRGGLMAVLNNGTEFGREISDMGDIDGDGLPELAVRVTSDLGTFSGYVLSLGPDGHVMREQEIAPTMGAATAGVGSLDDLFVSSLTGTSAPFSIVDPGTVDDVFGLTGSDPFADFTSDITSGTRPLTVNFQDLSSGTGLSAWAWDFDDGHPSTEQNPTHPFYVIQRYDVVLTVTGSLGSDTAFKPNYLYRCDRFFGGAARQRKRHQPRDLRVHHHPRFR